MGLSERCGELGKPSLTRVTISKIEAGIRRFVTVDEAWALARAFDVPVAVLLGAEPADSESAPTSRLDLNFPNPISRAADLHARSTALGHVQAAIQSHRLTVIMGERVTGKTSLMRVAARWAKEGPGIDTIYMPPVPSRAAFMDELLAGIGSKIDPSVFVRRLTAERAMTEFAHAVTSVAGGPAHSSYVLMS